MKFEVLRDVLLVMSRYSTGEVKDVKHLRFEWFPMETAPGVGSELGDKIFCSPSTSYIGDVIRVKK